MTSMIRNPWWPWLTSGPGPSTTGPNTGWRASSSCVWRNRPTIGETSSTPTILYNLVTMAIEKLVMAALMRCGRLPDNHTLHDLVAALERWLPETVRGLAGPLCELDSFQDICDPYAGTITAPSRREVESMLILARKLEERLAMGTVVPPKEHRERP